MQYMAHGRWYATGIVLADGRIMGPLRIGYNLVPFKVQTPDALDIQSVVLVTLGSDTHAYDMEQQR